MKLELSNKEIWTLKQLLQSRISAVEENAKVTSNDPEEYEVYGILKGIENKCSCMGLTNGQH